MIHCLTLMIKLQIPLQMIHLDLLDPMLQVLLQPAPSSDSHAATVSVHVDLPPSHWKLFFASQADVIAVNSHESQYKTENDGKLGKDSLPSRVQKYFIGLNLVLDTSFVNQYPKSGGKIHSRTILASK